MKSSIETRDTATVPLALGTSLMGVIPLSGKRAASGRQPNSLAHDRPVAASRIMTRPCWLDGLMLRMAADR